MSRQTISCAIVVFNEERNIRDCLDTAKWMDEIVVVDAYSSDRTREICKHYTDRVFERPWRGHGDQKNFAIEQATGDWIFILDADERLTPELRVEIEKILASGEQNEAVAYYVSRRNYFYGKWVRWAGCYPDYQLRLFRRGVGLFDDAEPHVRFVFKGKAEYFEASLLHLTERTINDHFRKFRNFTTLAAQERGKVRQSVYWTDLTVRPLFTFYKYFLARRGFLDGMHGFLISVWASMYTFVKYAKLWESLREPRNRL